MLCIQQLVLCGRLFLRVENSHAIKPCPESPSHSSPSSTWLGKALCRQNESDLWRISALKTDLTSGQHLLLLHLKHLTVMLIFYSLNSDAIISRVLLTWREHFARSAYSQRQPTPKSPYSNPWGSRYGPLFTCSTHLTAEPGPRQLGPTCALSMLIFPPPVSPKCKKMSHNMKV